MEGRRRRLDWYESGSAHEEGVGCERGDLIKPGEFGGGFKRLLLGLGSQEQAGF
ncbi:hypothetical protein M2165_003998 [Variovorax sp. TBS-050B]|nr:hypothetical protein [Variovorax sp. TBS-050B]